MDVTQKNKEISNSPCEKLFGLFFDSKFIFQSIMYNYVMYIFFI